MKRTRGFSLLETLLYLGIFAIIGGSLFGILTNVVRISTQEISGDEVSSQLQFAMETVSRLVRESSAIETATTTTGTLKLRMNDPALDPTCIFVEDGVLKMSSGPDEFQKQNCASASTDLTTSKVIVDTAFFKRVEFPGGHDQVAVDLQFSNTATGPSKISRALRSGISRVSAATFDSDLLPNADNSYEVGFSGTKRWKNISLSNLLNLGVISSDPSGIDGSIYYNSTSKSFRGKADGTWGDLGSSLWLATSTNSMYANITGNVGIGTSNPGAPLQVNSATGGAIRLQYTGNSGYAQMETNGGSDFIFKTSGSQGTNTRMTILEASGNVGIGTASPGQKLTVSGGDLQVESGQGRFKAWRNTGATGRALEVGISSGTGFIYNYDPVLTTHGDIVIGGGGAGFNIKANGDVGIGTIAISSGLRLDVEGKVGATEYCDANGENCKTITAMGGSTITAVSFASANTTGDAICASVGKSCITTYNYNGAYNVACYYTHTGIGAYCY